MPRYKRNTAILAKIEVTPGVDAAPAGASDAVLVSDFDITPLDATNVDRDLLRSYFGASEQLVATACKKLTFSVEFAGSGTAATAPQWGKLLQACAMAEALLTTPNRVEYTPVSTLLKTLTIYYHDDGVLHKLLYAMGSVKLSAKIGERPLLQFSFIGVDGGDTAVANPSVTLSAWKVPPTMAKSNVTDITIGSTYATGALTGGTVYPSNGLEIDLGNAVNYVPLLSSERVDITDRDSTGSMELDLTAAQEVSFMGIVKANTLQSVAITIGTTSGNKMIVHAPSVQLLNPKKVDKNGARMIGYDMRLVPTPSGTGNDELRIACV